MKALQPPCRARTTDYRRLSISRKGAKALRTLRTRLHVATCLTILRALCVSVSTSAPLRETSMFADLTADSRQNLPLAIGNICRSHFNPRSQNPSPAVRSRTAATCRSAFAGRCRALSAAFARWPSQRSSVATISRRSISSSVMSAGTAPRRHRFDRCRAVDAVVAQPRPQFVGRDRSTLIQHAGPRDDVLQLAHIAGPVVVAQQLASRRFERRTACGSAARPPASRK